MPLLQAPSRLREALTYWQRVSLEYRGEPSPEIYPSSQASSLDELASLDHKKLEAARLKLEFIEAVAKVDWDRVERLAKSMRTA